MVLALRTAWCGCRHSVTHHLSVLVLSDNEDTLVPSAVTGTTTDPTVPSQAGNELILTRTAPRFTMLPEL